MDEYLKQARSDWLNSRTFQAVDNLILHLESQQEAQSRDLEARREIERLWQAVRPETSSSSSAPIPGPAPKPSMWPTANPVTYLSFLTAAITAYSRSMLFTAPELEATFPDSSTLQLTLRWPTPSGESKVGGHGAASHSASEGELR